MMRIFLGVFMLISCAARCETVAVKYPEGTLQGYLAVRSADGKRIGTGVLVQSVTGDRVKARLIYRFMDGSIDDESTVFTQRGTFHLVSDHHVQKGPSFPHPLDMEINSATGDITQRTLKDGKPTVEKTHMDLPDDLTNGSIFSVIKNLHPTNPLTRVSYLGATPKPRLVKLEIATAQVDSFRVGPLRQKAQCFVVHIALGGVAGVVAPLIGKQPGDIRVWVAEGEAPAFIREEGAFYEGGPVWIVELTSPVWGAGGTSTRAANATK
jgi:hypothetical protein